jgi:hypothetical protein
MSEVIEKRTAVDVYDDITLKMGHIVALLDIMGECDKGAANVNEAAYGIQSMIEDATELAGELYQASNGGAS